MCENEVFRQLLRGGVGLKKFGLIGQPLSHSFSPEIHALFGDYEYKLYPLLPEQLPDFMKNNELSGFNVTIPYKSDILPYCSKLSKRAENIGCVNTVIRQADGSYFGDNTDYLGFRALLGADAEKIGANKVLILGNGSTAKAVRTVLYDKGINNVVTVSRLGQNNYTNISSHYDSFLIVNTTPVGMYPDNGKAVINLDDFFGCSLVLDLIYNPAKTALLLQAEKLGIRCRNGLYMLVFQAKEASRLFTGEQLSDERATDIYNILSLKMKNVLLIGMPGCGKTATGKKLAEITSRPFYDTDELISEAAGMDVPRIFSEKGEEYFRKLETRVLKEVSKKSGAVIAAGGGIVMLYENHDLLRQNSTVVLIERDISELDRSDRPVSQKRNIKELYLERQPLYEKLCDFKVENISPEKTAEEISRRLQTAGLDFLP